MANSNRPLGFSPVSSNPRAVNVRLTSSVTVVKGDALFLHTDGYVTASQKLGKFVGIAASSPLDGTTGLPKATSSATAGTDYIKCWTADNEFDGQILLGAVTDPDTTYTTAAFDMVTTSGASYITASASTYDTCRITGVASEENGKKSQPGDYQKVFWRAYNPTNLSSTMIADSLM